MICSNWDMFIAYGLRLEDSVNIVNLGCLLAILSDILLLSNLTVQ